MTKKKKWISAVTILCVLSLMLPMCVSAEEDSEGSMGDTAHIEIDSRDYDNTDELNKDVNDAIQKYEQVTIICDETSEDDSTDENPDYPVMRSGAADAVSYRVANVKKLKNTFGGNYINISGEPDVVIGLSHAKSKSYPLTVGATYKVSKKMILNATWGTTKGVTLTYSGTWKVPEKHNGKKVKYGYLHMRPEYSVKQYSVQSRSYGTTKWVTKHVKFIRNINLKS